MILRKDQLEASLHEEKKLIENGKLKEDSPLDFSPAFSALCRACREGDLKACQEAIDQGANINSRDEFDYTPLILASLCGHYDTVHLLLERGALCERDTFQGERCLYNALNDRIRNLLIAYDYSKSTDPLQPFAAHITSLLSRDDPKTSDITVTSTDKSLNLHKFLLAARSPFFRKKLSNTPETTTWKILSHRIPPPAFEIAIKYLYLGDLPNDVGGGPGTGFTEEEILEGIDKLSKLLEMPSLWEGILEMGDRRLARQNRSEETQKGRKQLEVWFTENVVHHKLRVETSKAGDVRWDRDNGIYADVLLRADDVAEDDDVPVSLPSGVQTPVIANTQTIPIGPIQTQPDRSTYESSAAKSTLYPAHRAMLLRSEYFNAMFSSSFLEAQSTEHLQIIAVDCSPQVLEAVLAFLYTEKTDFPLEIAVDVLFAADQLLIERLKAKAAQVISTLGNGSARTAVQRRDENEVISSPSAATEDEVSDETIDPFTVIRAAWLLRVPRLEEFVAKYFAQRLERYIDLPEFAELVAESAARIKERQETDSIELIDDIRFYLSERFRLRFEGDGIEEMLGDEAENEAEIFEDETNIEKEPKGSDGPFLNGESENLDRTADNGDTRVPNGDHHALESSGGGQIRTLDGEIAGDEFDSDAINYQILLGKIDTLLEKLQLDA